MSREILEEWSQGGPESAAAGGGGYRDSWEEVGLEGTAGEVLRKESAGRRQEASQAVAPRGPWGHGQFPGRYVRGFRGSSSRPAERWFMARPDPQRGAGRRGWGRMGAARTPQWGQLPAEVPPGSHMA